MRKKYMFYSLLVILALQVVSCSSEKTTTKQSQEIPDHPRIIINKQEIHQLTKTISTSNYLRGLNTVILNVADGMQFQHSFCYSSPLPAYAPVHDNKDPD